MRIRERLLRVLEVILPFFRFGKVRGEGRGVEIEDIGEEGDIEAGGGEEGDIGDSNRGIRDRQRGLILAVVVTVIFIIGGMVYIFFEVRGDEEDNNQNQKEIEKSEEQHVSVLELPDVGIDMEKRWRQYFESLIENQSRQLEKQLEEMRSAQSELMKNANEEIERVIGNSSEKLEFAKRELAEANLEVRRMREEMEVGRRESVEVGAKFGRQEFESEIEMDRPKPVENYVAEGTYFTGHLLGGIVVSTALNTADEHATPVMIRLTGRGNLPKGNDLKIEQCRIQGSAYGDVSSERAIIRLEKMICEVDGVYQTSKIAGQLFGPDGYNGIKGVVVSTGSKHLKNAFIGGVLSGLSESSGGREGMSISGAGIISTEKRGMRDMVTGGSMKGLSNAGEKLADYYLRQAEAMSPVLTIPSGVRVNAQITRGFYVGEVGTHKKLQGEKR